MAQNGWTVVPEAAGWTRVDESTPVSADEPSDYWSGALKGAAEGIEGGAKGFVKGLTDSPASFVNGLVTLLSQSPKKTVTDTIEALKQLPDAVRAAGGNPEKWGRDVGDVTGQTMIGIATPSAATAAAKAIPVAARISAVPAGMVVGGAMGHATGIPGAGAVGSAVGGALAHAAREAMTAAPEATAATTEAARTAALLSSAEPIKAFDFFKMLRTLPPDTQKTVLAARQAALAAEPAAPAPTTASVAAAAPVEAPAAAQAAPSAPIAAPPAPPVTRSVFTPGEALSAARQAFEAAGERPRAAELSNVAAMMKFGKSAEQAVAEVIANRPKLSPAEEFNATFGLKTPSGNELRFPKGMRGASTGGYQ